MITKKNATSIKFSIDSGACFISGSSLIGRPRGSNLKKLLRRSLWLGILEYQLVHPRRNVMIPTVHFTGLFLLEVKSFDGIVVVSSKSSKMVVVAKEYPHLVGKYKRLERRHSKVTCLPARMHM